MNGLAMELISHAHLVWKRRVSKELVPYGTNPKQMYVLRRLIESGPLAPSQIAELIHSDRPTATSMIGTLERAGWVGRSRDPHDGKRVLVEITSSGRAFFKSVPESLWRNGATKLDPEACLSKAERGELVRLLTKLNDWMDSNS